MEQFFSLSNLFTLAMLIILQAVLGFDNLLYVSIESKRAPAQSQAKVRRLGIGLAIGLRIVLLFVVQWAITRLQTPFLIWHWDGVFETQLSGHAFIVLIGGAFILYTATQEIFHMMNLEEHEHGAEKQAASVTKVVTMIVIMNLVFSFDSILSAIALTPNGATIATAILISGALMIWLADHVSEFLKKNRIYEVLGLFILFVVGIMLVTEGGELAHIKIFGNPVEPMRKTTFYFVIFILIAVDVVQTRYQKKLLQERQMAGSH